MNRVLKRFLISLGLLVVVVIGAIVALFGPVVIGMKPIPDDYAFNGMRLVQDEFTTLWILPVGQDEVAVIDAGEDGSGAAVISELSRRGLSADAVVAVFLTHGHQDHIGAVSLFPNAEVMALAAEADLVAGRVAPSSPLGRMMSASSTGIEVTRMLRDGETVRIGEAEIKVYAVPGRTAGSAAYLTNGALFLGDAGNVTSDDTVKGPPWIFSADVDQANTSLTRLGQRLASENVDLDLIAFSHSGPLAQGLAPLAALTASD